jgi:hypothetical protein
MATWGIWLFVIGRRTLTSDLGENGVKTLVCVCVWRQEVFSNKCRVGQKDTNLEFRLRWMKSTVVCRDLTPGWTRRESLEVDIQCVGVKLEI